MDEEEQGSGGIFWLMLAIGIVGVIGFVLVAAGAAAWEGDMDEKQVYDDALELAFDAVKTAEAKSSPLSKTDVMTMAGLWCSLAVAVELRTCQRQAIDLDANVERIVNAQGQMAQMLEIIARAMTAVPL